MRRCVYRGGRTGWDQRWHHSRRGCALYTDPALEEKGRGEHRGFRDLTLDEGVKAVTPFKTRTFDVRLGARGAGRQPAKQWGMRVTHEDGFVSEIAYDAALKTLSLLGRETYFDPKRGSSSAKDRIDRKRGRTCVKGVRHPMGAEFTLQNVFSLRSLCSFAEVQLTNIG